MKLTSPSNFRTLPLVKPHTLFRSDHLGALNEDDARQIQSLGIRRVLDFRGVNERESQACRLPEVTVHSLAIEPTIVQKIADMVAEGRQLSEADVVALMQDTYRGFVRGSTHRFSEFFAYLLESAEPTVFHCTAGKDRTGFAAAMVLYALGASDDVVMRDYLRTNDLLKPSPLAVWEHLPPQSANVLFRVQPEFLQASFDAIREDFGSVAAYLQEGLNLRKAESDRLRELYLG